MKVLTITNGDGNTTTVTEIHMLNPREFFDGFGGSRSGLQVGKTASLITRTKSAHGWRDVEYNIHDAHAWAHLVHLIRAASQADIKLVGELFNEIESEAVQS